MTADAWSRPSACVAAQSVFSLALENPLLRPGSSTAAQRASLARAPGVRSIPREALEEVIEALPPEDVARVVGLAEQIAPERWRVLVDEVGIDLAREPLLVGVATAAVAELVPPPRWLLVMRETTAATAPGEVNVLATLLRPESVWSADEIRAGHSLGWALPLPDALETIRALAARQGSEWRIERARLVARSVARALPVAEAPRTTRQLRDALALVGREEGAVELCGLLLVGAVMQLEGLVPTVPSPN